jgi:hypothetical protein
MPRVKQQNPGNPDRQLLRILGEFCPYGFVLFKVSPEGNVHVAQDSPSYVNGCAMLKTIENWIEFSNEALRKDFGEEEA